MKPKYLPEHPNMVENHVLRHFKNPLASQLEGVVVNDGICGIGKTEGVIEQINKEFIGKKSKRRVLYVSPYLEELHRVAGTTFKTTKEGITKPVRDKNKKLIYEATRKVKIDFEHPESKPTKLIDFKALVRNNSHIVITHSLFCSLDKEAVDLLKEKEYHLFLDEEPKLMEEIDADDYPIAFGELKRIKAGSSIKTFETREIKGLYSNELNNLVDLGVLKVTGTQVTWGKFELQRYADIKKEVVKNNIIAYKDQTNPHTYTFIWRLNPEIFYAFRSVQVLTYLFRNSLLQAYFDIEKIPYLIQDQTSEKIFDGDYVSKDGKKQGPHPYHKLIHLHDLTEEDFKIDDECPFSAFNSSWFDYFMAANPKPSDDNIIRQKLVSFFKYKTPFTSYVPSPDERLFTTVSKALEHVEGKGYTTRFLPFNHRASNNYRSVIKMAYVYNVFLMPGIKNYLSAKGVDVTKTADTFALSTLIQWIFRSSLRDGNNVELLLPSNRMRNLLKGWMNKYKELYEFSREVRDHFLKPDPDFEDYQDLITPVTYDVFYQEYQPGLKNYNIAKLYPVLQVKKA